MKKKLLAVLLVVVAISLLATGCSYTECDLCGEKGFCDTREILTKEIDVCGDCQDKLDEAGDALDSLGDKLGDLL